MPQCVRKRSQITRVQTKARIVFQTVRHWLTYRIESPLLLATYNGEKELRVYRLSLDFEHQSINLQHLKVLDYCAPLDENLDGASAQYDGVQSRSQLSLLEFLPPGPRSANKEPTHAVLLASFSYVSDHFQHSPAHAVQSTVLCKWELQIATPKLHASFSSLSSKKTSASPVAELPVSCIAQSLVFDCV